MSDLDLSNCPLERRHLEILVESDGPLAPYAKALLEALDSTEESEGSELIQ